MQGKTPRFDWAQVWLRLGLLLMLIGAGPALIADLIFPGSDPLIPFLLLLGVTPLGVLCLVIGVLVWLMRRLRS